MLRKAASKLLPEELLLYSPLNSLKVQGQPSLDNHTKTVFTQQYFHNQIFRLLDHNQIFKSFMRELKLKTKHLQFKLFLNYKVLLPHKLLYNVSLINIIQTL